jgi:hypothetical protein
LILRPFILLALSCIRFSLKRQKGPPLNRAPKRLAERWPLGSVY